MDKGVIATVIVETDEGKIFVSNKKSEVSLPSVELNSLKDIKNDIAIKLIEKHNLILKDLSIFKKILWSDENKREIFFIAKEEADSNKKELIKCTLDQSEKLINDKTTLSVLKEYRRYKGLINELKFNTFLAFKMTKDDLYPPEELYKVLSKDYIKKCWVKTTNLIKEENAPGKIGLFFYIPFCTHGCKYCCTYYHIPKESKIVKRYLKYLYNEIDYFKDIFKNTEFTSLYFGGGTPTYLSAKQTENLFAKVENSFSISKTSQIMFEVAPANVTLEKLRILKKHKVNRITIGVQSMNEAVLREQNRFQTEKQVIDAFRNARKVGIEQINIDMIAGLKNESFESFVEGMKKVIALKPDMVYLYPFDSCGTKFSKQSGRLNEGELRLRHEMAKKGTEMLSGSGFNVIEHAFLGKSPESRNLQETDELEFNSSILGFGTNARSHAFGALYYGNPNYNMIERNKIDSLYMGYPVDIKDEMIKYIVTNLRSPKIKETFFQLFKKNLIDEFRDSFEKLQILRKASLADNLFLNIKNRQEQLTYSKFFYKSEHINQLKKTYSGSFNQNIDYRKELERAVDSIQ